VLAEVEELVVLSVVSSDDLRFIVGRSGSSAGSLPVLFAVDVFPEEEVVLASVPLLSVRRFMVGRSGSSAGAGDAVDDVVVLSVVLSDRRFIVGRSGSSDDVLPELFADPESAVVLPEGVVDVVLPVVPGSLESEEERRFMVGRSGSLFEVLVVPVPVLVLESALLWLVVEAVLSEVFVCSCGRLLFVDEVVLFELTMAGNGPFEGWRAAGFRGAASGLTLP
jgi:hypothetical protein